MDTFSLLSVICCLTLVTPQCINDPNDPCTNYRTLNDHTRSTAYSDSQSNNLGDSSILQGWYRSTSPAGGDMPVNTAPVIGYCQAISPIWLQGSLPNVAEGIVPIQACIQSFTNNCSTTLSLCVKNCTSYNVYFLYRPTSTYPRYCFGNELPCPSGFYSSNDFTPGCKEINETLEENPIVSYTNNQTIVSGGLCQKQTIFLCSVTHDYAKLHLEVTWSVAGNTIKSENITVSQQPARLTKADLQSAGITKYGFTLKCAVAGRKNSSSTPGNTRSTEYIVGFSVPSIRTQIKEHQTPTQITLNTTVPLNFKYDCGMTSDVANSNYLTLTVQQTATTQQASACSTRGSELVFQKNINEHSTCTTTISLPAVFMSGNLAQIEIPLYGLMDGRYDSDEKINLQIGTGLTNTIDPMWQGVDIQVIELEVLEQDYLTLGGSCYIANDPHVKTFDGKYFDMKQTGFFTLYKHKTLPIEVEVYLKQATTFSKVCGAAVKSGGDTYVIDYCQESGLFNKFYKCQSNTQSLRNIRVITLDNTFTILLPTGGKLSINQQSIIFYPSVLDYENTEGLCGLFNGDCKDDLKIKGTGNIDPEQTNANCPCNQHCKTAVFYPDTFSNSWRVSDTATLFKESLTTTQTYFDTRYCNCDSQGRTTCTYTAATESCAKYGTDVTDNQKTSCSAKKRSNSYTDNIEITPSFTYNVNFVPEVPSWRNSWTDSTATTYCENYFSNKQSMTICSGVNGVDIPAGIATCILDIYISGTSEYSQVHLDIVLSNCMEEIRRNDTLYNTQVTNSNGQVVSLAENMLASLCPGDCNNHGSCINGVCTCTSQYTGVDCSQIKSYVPTLKTLPTDGLCDKLTRPCQSTVVYGDMFIDSSDLTCKFQIQNLEGTSVTGMTTSSAQFVNFQKLNCQLPTHNSMPYKVEVTVSNNNMAYSNSEYLVVYNSKCWDCTIYSCTQKSSICVINGECYDSGTKNPADSSQHCSPSNDAYDWSSDNENNNSLTLIAAIVTSGVVFCVILIIAAFFIHKQIERKMHRSKKPALRGNAYSISHRGERRVDSCSSLGTITSSANDNRVYSPPPRYEDNLQPDNYYSRPETPVKDPGMRSQVHMKHY